jgi:hypothetical protein
MKVAMNIYDTKKDVFNKIKFLFLKAIGEVLLLICIFAGVSFGIGKLFG